MQELDFSLDGVAASSVGIQLQRPLSFTKAVPRVQTIQLAGRNGDLHIDDGTFDNRVGTANCFALTQFIVVDKMTEIMQFLFSKRGYRELRTSEDSKCFWYARVSNAGELAPRLNMLNPFTVEFDCKPFRVVEGSEELVDNQTFVNPTGFDAYPLLYIETAGIGAKIQNNRGIIDFPYGADDIYIDCEDRIAYRDTGESWDSVIRTTNTIYFSSGGNTLHSNDVTFKVAPRWRTL